MGSVFYYLIYKISGTEGLVILRLFLFLLVIGIYVFYARRKMPLWALLATVFLMSFALSERCLLRPFVFNLIIYQFFLIALLSYQRTLKVRWLWLIPIFGLPWVNLHLGSFVYTALLLTAFILPPAANYLEQKLKREPSLGEITASKKQLKDLTLFFTFYAVISLITPYGLDGALHGIKSFLVSDYLSFYKLNRSIAELQAPTDLFTVRYSWFFILFTFTIYSLLKIKEKKFPHFLLFVFTLFLFLYGRRAIAIHALTCGYIIAEAFRQMDENEKNMANKAIHNLVMIILIGTLSVFIVRQASARYYIDGKTYTNLSLREDQHSPKTIVDLLEKNRIQGRMFNDDRYGGYFLFHAYPGIKPFVDSRQLNYKIYDIYHAIRRDPENFWPMFEQKYDFKIIFLDASKLVNAKMIRYFNENKDWQLVFVKGSQVLFVKKNVFELSPDLDHFQSDLKTLEGNLAKINTNIPLKSQTSTSDIFAPTFRYIEPLATAITLYDMGYKAASFQSISEALIVSPSDKNIFTVYQLMLSNL